MRWKVADGEHRAIEMRRCHLYLSPHFRQADGTYVDVIDIHSFTFVDSVIEIETLSPTHVMIRIKRKGE